LSPAVTPRHCWQEENSEMASASARARVRTSAEKTGSQAAGRRHAARASTSTSAPASASAREHRAAGAWSSTWKRAVAPARKACGNAVTGAWDPISAAPPIPVAPKTRRAAATRGPTRPFATASAPRSTPTRTAARVAIVADRARPASGTTRGISPVSRRTAILLPARPARTARWPQEPPATTTAAPRRGVLRRWLLRT
jgi:hypothetical protein